MIWLAWKQRRGTIVVAAIMLAVVALILVLTGRPMSNSFHEGGLAECIERLNAARFIPVEGAKTRLRPSRRRSSRCDCWVSCCSPLRR